MRLTLAQLHYFKGRAVTRYMTFIFYLLDITEKREIKSISFKP